ncbi:MAG TPA: adenylosuccinate lyase family protein [Mycobacteriales bacterium]|nr:adenylosuccinate lyase family protein [Mycobacteriales bacterium]
MTGVDAGLFSPVRAGTEVEGLTSDEAFLQAMLDAEAALARAQARLGLVPSDAAKVITDLARVGNVDLVAIAHEARDGANPVVPLVPALTAAVRAADPIAAGYVHKGSTSQDILDTGLMLLSSRALRVILRDLEATAAALGRLAAAHRDTPAVGRTLTQHAVPITFGLKAVGWYELVSVAADRVRALLATLPVSLGGAAGTLAAYIEHARLHDPSTEPAAFADGLVTAFAAETGLAEQVLPWHTLRVPVADLGATLALVTGALGKFALDVRNLSRTEVGEVAEPAAPGRGGSSAMPHKRNPVLATLILSAGLQVPLQAAVLAQCLVAEDERPAGAWHAEWAPLQTCLRLAGGAAETAAELAGGLVVFPDRLRANLDLTGSLVVSERIAAVLAAALGKAEAKAVIGAASATANESRRSLGDVLKESAEVTAHLSAAEMDALLDPLEYLGAAAHLVDRTLARRPPPPDPRPTGACRAPARPGRRPWSGATGPARS